MIDEGYKQSTPPIKLTKIRPPQPDIPRDNFKVRVSLDNSPQWDFNEIVPQCMRCAEKNGISYAITYWDCPYEILAVVDEFGSQTYISYDCAKCEMVTWIEVEI